MIKNFGLNRVLEPRGVVPATAWKIDNCPILKDKEARVSLERLQIEWDSFQQICSSCNFDELRIRQKIFDIIEKRGKMHNPFTGTGGTLVGRIEEIPEDLKAAFGVDVGDRIYSLTSLCGIPLKLEEITSIDYNYGQIECKGYAILFEASPIHKWDSDVGVNYELTAINEAGCLRSAYELAKKDMSKNVTIIGRNSCTNLIFAAAVKKGNPDCHIMAIIDPNVRENVDLDKINSILSPVVDETRFADLSDPTMTYRAMKEEIEGFENSGLVLVAEDTFGAETLAVLLAKEGGHIYFSTVQNHYAIAQTVAETMGKFVNMSGFDQYIKDYAEFTLNLIHDIEPKLKKLDRYYETINKPDAMNESRARSIVLKNTGKDDDFIYQSRVTRMMIDEVMNIAKYDCNVIIQGETGVGKEKVLSLIHQNSERYGQPCVKINCATIPENLAESEFFGYEPGSFTGAGSQGKVGYFEMANGGILFLDEIGSLSMNMQSKLLRVLQENTFYRVGGTKQVSVNVRVIVANNVPLKTLVEEGKFREDLFYRLNICNIDVPPLRQRRDDITCLAEAFTKNWSQKYGIERDISKEALAMLREYNWPGNVRELENIIHRLVISCNTSLITGDQVGDILSENMTAKTPVCAQRDFDKQDEVDFHGIMENQEKLIIEYALKKCGTTRKAAEFIGLPQTTFARKKLKYGL